MCVLIAALSPTPGFARGTATPVQMEIENPRPFGYVIGDLLQRRIYLQGIPSGSRPVLPEPARIDQWLELLEARGDIQRDSRGTRWQLTFTYQLVNSPQAVRQLTLPPLTLRFGGSAPLVASIPGWSFTAAPLTPISAGAPTGVDELRPDRAPRPIATQQSFLRLLLYGLAIAAILLYGAIRYFVLPHVARRNLPFARAYREVEQLRRSSAQVASFGPALRRVHRAFDELNGRPVFADQLEGFFCRHARFAALRSETEQFFQLSRRAFFEDGEHGTPQPWEWLVSFCKTWWKVESGRAP